MYPSSDILEVADNAGRIGLFGGLARSRLHNFFFGNFYGFPKSVVALYSETLTSQEGYTHSLKDTKGTHSTQIRGIYIDGW